MIAIKAKKSFKFQKSWIKWILVIAILVIVGLIYVPTLEKKAPEKEIEPVIVPQQKEPVGAQFGDLVEINYVLKLENGTVVDTNNETLAKKYGVSIYVKGPYRFILGESGKLLGQGVKVKAFDEAIKGLEAGDKKTVSIEPSEKVLSFAMNLTAKEQRRTTIPRIHRFSVEKFKETFSKPGIIGDVVANHKKYPWNYQVLNVSENSVYAKILLENGDEVIIPGTEWKSLAVDVAELAIIFVQNPSIGQVISTPYGTAAVTNATAGYIWLEHRPELGKTSKQVIAADKEAGPTYDFTVQEITDDRFTIRRTNYLPQEKLTLYAEVLDVTTDIKVK